MFPRFGFSWSDLYTPEKLSHLQDRFKGFLRLHSPELLGTFETQQELTGNKLIETALEVEQFIIELFGLESESQAKYDLHHRFRLASHFKRNFIQRDALHSSSQFHDNGAELIEKLSNHLGQDLDSADEITFAHLGLAALSREDNIAIDLFKRYAIWAHSSNEGKTKHSEGFLFNRPEKTDPDHRFPWQSEPGTLYSAKQIPRTGFDLTDPGISSAHATDEAYYCIKCHERDKDTCRKGFLKNRSYLNDTHEQPLSGCPLDQKISEMNVLFEQGHLIAALAVVTLDNPMVAATGHRICYDCSRSCIFQKQTPVDIPSIETRLLKDMLALPYGFEIYSLLTRWNPLNLDHPVAGTNSGYNVLVVGQGPAGFALAHLMMRYGHQVTAIDAMKIPPLPSELKDITKPIQRISQYWERLSERFAQGFGGVAEYGITSRWDKNFLLVIRLLLERQSLYRCLDSVRFGSSITIQSAFNEYGFDHIALCLGAGSPTLLNDPNMTAPGVRLASDFLMGLNLGAAAQLDTKTTLRIRLPVVVVGAGLTAVDAATEALAYYPIQVMNFYKRYQHVLKTLGEEEAKKILAYDPQVAQTFLEHGRTLLNEQELAQQENRPPNYLQYTKAWGGVTIYYRKRIQDSPSYRLNPHELKSALQEGVQFIENATPSSIETDEKGHLSHIIFNRSDKQINAPAKTLLVAAGTKPNTVLANEYKDEFSLDGDFFKPSPLHSLAIHTTKTGHYVSYLGDLHPQYSGSVVKALASAKFAAPIIHQDLVQRPPKSLALDENTFKSYVVDIKKIENTLLLTIRSCAAAQAYQPGNFYRLHPYESAFSEAIPLTPTQVNKDSGELEFQINVVGATTQHLMSLKPKDRVSLMGPTGSPLPFDMNTNILFVQEASLTLPILEPLLSEYPNSQRIKLSSSNELIVAELKKYEILFVAGSFNFIDRFKKFSTDINVYSFVYTHTQCTMKQVCAQCIYSTYDADRNMHEIKFGCAENIINVNNVDTDLIKKRNKNEVLEERLLHSFHNCNNN